jgi:flagellar hook assembly protein FlgD
MMIQRTIYYALAAVLLIAAAITIPTTLPADEAAMSMRAVHPNPFTDKCTFELTMPRDGDVKITVYNIRGEEVKVLLDGYKQKGVWPIPWDGTDQTDQPVLPGIYVCVLFSENTAVKSVKVVKSRK